MSDTETDPKGPPEQPQVQNVEDTKQQQILIDLNRRKRARKRATTKARYELEKLSAKNVSGEIEELEQGIETLWLVLEETQGIMDELSGYFLEQKDFESQKLVMKESNALEAECQSAIEKAQSVIVKCVAVSQAVSQPAESEATTLGNGDETVVAGNQENLPPVIVSVSDQNTDGNSQSSNNAGATSEATTMSSVGASEHVQSVNVHNESIVTGVSQQGVTIGTEAPIINHRLKPLKVPDFDGDKRKFEEFWGMFQSLVDRSNEPISLKMARLRQCLSGTALDSIRGLGVSEAEYEEAKKILEAKFGGQRRQLRAYLDDLERMQPLRAADVQGFQRFTDLVRVTVVKLQAEGKEGELGDGTLYSLLVKKLTGWQLEAYTRWMNEHKNERSVLSLRDWLKEEVSVRVEAIEMAHGLDKEDDDKNSRKPYPPKFGGEKTPSSFFTDSGQEVNSGKDRNPTPKPPCTFCKGLHHGIWGCRQFERKSVEERWTFAKENQLCFRCLSKDHRGKDCQRSQQCKVNGCRLNHHRLLHRQPPSLPPPETPVSHKASGEGATQGGKVAMTTQHNTRLGEQCSLRTVPVWLKCNGKKVKVNAILDDASNETFLNENVAQLLGIQEKMETVQVHVLNNSIETFQSMPAKVEIESVNGEFGKVIEVRTCPHQVTGAYKVEDWNETKRSWPHLVPCDFPKPAHNGLVDLLIGVDNVDLHYSKVDVHGPPGGPIARLGPLGWTCVGPTGRSSEKRSHLIIHSFLTRETCKEKPNVSCCEVNDTLRKFWEIEEYGTEVKRTEVMTKEERQALEKVETSLNHNGSRYSVAVPWKEEFKGLPNNRETAMKRLECTERSLKAKDSFVRNEYEQTIKSYIEKGYIRKLSPDETSSSTAWYLPHFP